MPEVARPWALLLLLPLLAWGWHLRRHPGWVLSHPLPPSSPWVCRSGRGRPLPLPTPWVLRLLALGAMVAALASPWIPLPPSGEGEEGVAIVVALDLSGSMGTRDLGGRTRMDAARAEVLRFIRGRPRDRIGLVTFAEEAATRVPPTLSHGHLAGVVSSLRLSSLDQGTAMGVGIGLAAHRLVQVESPSRVVVLLSDGRSNMGALDPLSVTGAAAMTGVRIHAVGLGSGGGEDPLDEEILREIARATGGEYFRAGDPAGLTRVMDAIDALEKGPTGGAAPGGRRSLHPVLLLVAIGLLGAEGLARALPGARIR